MDEHVYADISIQIDDIPMVKMEDVLKNIGTEFSTLFGGDAEPRAFSHNNKTYVVFSGGITLEAAAMLKLKYNNVEIRISQIPNSIKDKYR